jgi:hypothetical protein
MGAKMVGNNKNSLDKIRKRMYCKKNHNMEE